MNKILLLVAALAASHFSACQKSKSSGNYGMYGNGPRTNVPAQLRGNWMYGQFSMTEYWAQNPADYIGNAFQFAIAFRFNSDGTYEQYFTSSTVSGSMVYYLQSVTKGTVEVDEANSRIITHAHSAYYKKSRNGQTLEERSLDKSEITATSRYTYELRTESNGTKAVYLKLDNTESPIQFLQKS